MWAAVTGIEKNTSRFSRYTQAFESPKKYE